MGKREPLLLVLPALPSVAEVRLLVLELDVGRLADDVHIIEHQLLV